MDLYVCEKCFVVRELDADSAPPEACPACGASGSMVEAYVSERFARREPAEAPPLTRRQM